MYNKRFVFPGTDFKFNKIRCGIQPLFSCP